jgi:[protein-PII] uridylyltransferase
MAAQLKAFLARASDRYLRTIPPATIGRHFLLRRDLAPGNAVAWRLMPEAGSGLSELSVCAQDTPGLFHYICGALAAKGINIWSARIFSTPDGDAINQFLVTDLENRPLPPGMRLERLRRDLNQVILGRKTIGELIQRHKGRPRRRPRVRRPLPTAVLFDNEGSDSYTILEVRAADRPGLLYQITGALTRRRLDIHRAIIATEAYGVVDVFYVTDLEYNKIYDPTHQSKIEREIMKAIGEPGIDA